MEKIRVLHCIETISSGGVEKLRLTIVEKLGFHRYEFKIICTNAKGQIANRLEELGVEIIQVGAFRHPLEYGKYSQVKKIVTSYNPHVIHGAVFEGMSMATIGGILGQVPVVILEETSDPKTRSFKAVLLQRLYTMFADKIIAISPAVLAYLHHKARIPPSKTILIKNGVPSSHFSDNKQTQQLRSSLNIDAGDIVVGSVGRIYNEIKRFSDLLDAVKLMNLPNLKFLLVGAGPDLEKLESRAVELGVEKHFIPVGYQGNPDLYYGLMDIFCLPSLHEGFGLVVAEAMFHHLPVVATSVGGLKDIVLDGETGFLVEPKSPTSLAERLKILIDDSDLRRRFGYAGHQRATKNYTAERYCGEVEGLYNELLKKKGIIS